jgi:transposase
MLSLLDIGKVIGMKIAGMSTRAISRQEGYDRERISEVWSEYNANLARLDDPDADRKAIMEKMNTPPKYDSSNRKKLKYTPAVEEALVEILKQEEAKTRVLGARHKQRLTNLQIHQKLVDAGHDIGRVTINNAIARLRKKLKEVHIRQHYDYGDRLEYDFGEVLLDCGKGIRKYHMAVLSSPASNFKWAYLYTNQKQAVFQDSHVRFFEMTGGAWREVVYDNMKNVVSKFIGRNEKELNRELLQMALYYGYTPNVTNCFKANEKGHVESSVQTLRNQIFAGRYKFSSLDEAQEYMVRRLEEINAQDWVDVDDEVNADFAAIGCKAAVTPKSVDAEHPQINKGCKIEEEKKHLLPYRPPLELATISQHSVDSYSFITVDNCKYSVPEYFVGKKVVVKKYHDEIRVFPISGAHQNDMICQHRRIFSKAPHGFGRHNMSVDIYHYIESLLRKPGAIRNSVALKSIPKLKAIFDTHYAKEPKKFIETFMEHKELCVDELIAKFEEITSNAQTNSAQAARAEFRALCVVGKPRQTEVAVRADMGKYAALIYKAGALSKAEETAAKPLILQGAGPRKEDLAYANNF